MAQGLQIFDGSGKVILDTSNTVFRVLGHVSVTTSGSMSVQLPPYSRPFAYQMPTYAGSYPSGSPPSVMVTFDAAGLLAWTIEINSSSAMSGFALNIIYGCY